MAVSSLTGPSPDIDPGDVGLLRSPEEMVGGEFRPVLAVGEDTRTDLGRQIAPQFGGAFGDGEPAAEFFEMRPDDLRGEPGFGGVPHEAGTPALQQAEKIKRERRRLTLHKVEFLGGGFSTEEIPAAGCEISLRPPAEYKGINVGKVLSQIVQTVTARMR